MTAEKHATKLASAMVKSAAVIPDWLPPEKPSWDRARKLVGAVRQGAECIVHLGMELEALRDEFFAPGIGGGRPTKTSPQGAAKLESPAFSHDATLFGPTEKGWQQKVRAELGISDDTAYRLIERGRTVCMIRDLAQGDVVTYDDSRGEKVEIKATKEIQALAVEMLDDVVSGTVAAKRAWAGIVGEGGRRGKGGSLTRAPVDHAKNIKKALVALRTSLKHWKHLTPPDRQWIEECWSEVKALIPETW